MINISTENLLYVKDKVEIYTSGMNLKKISERQSIFQRLSYYCPSVQYNQSHHVNIGPLHILPETFALKSAIVDRVGIEIFKRDCSIGRITLIGHTSGVTDRYFKIDVIEGIKSINDNRSVDDYIYRLSLTEGDKWRANIKQIEAEFLKRAELEQSARDKRKLGKI